MKWLGRLFRKRKLEAQIDSELRFHIEQKTADLIAHGVDPVEARRRAMAKLGGMETIKQEWRESRPTYFLGSVLQDVRYALRTLRKSPGFTIVAILTLALGIGANTAVFSIVDAALLRSLPFRDAARLVAISEIHRSLPEIGASVADFQDWQKESRSFEGLAAYNLTTLSHATLMVHGKPQEVLGAIVTHNLFPLLGIAPSLGRNFLPREDLPGAGPVAILSYRIWKTRFGGNPRILGQPLELNDKSYTVVGILRPGISFPQDVDVWVPMGNLGEANRTNRFYHPLFVLGRLDSGASVSAVRAEMNGIAKRLANVYPRTNHGIGVKLEPLLETYVAGLRGFLFLLWASVGLVLLIACANVASLLLARVTKREAEMTMRHALGASRAQLLRQGMTESIVLAALGGLAGLALAWVSLRYVAEWLHQTLNAPVLQLHRIGIDPVVLGVTMGVSILSGLLFGILPSLRASRAEPGTPFALGYHTSARARRRNASHAVVAGEVALAVVVLISAGLLLRSARRLAETSPGFRADHLLTMRLSLPGNKYNSRKDIAEFYQRLLPRLRALPGVEEVGTIDRTPLVPNLGVTRFLVDGAKPVRPGEFPVANYRFVSPGYFQTMDIPLLQGRLPEESDLSPSTPVLFVNRALAERFLHRPDPIGRKLLLGVATGKPTAIPIAGVVGDVRDLSIASPAPAEMYFAGYSSVSRLVIRTAVNPLSMAPVVRRTVLGIDPSQPVFDVQTGEQLVDRSMARERIPASLLALFSALALALAISGIYGVTSFTVSERTREIAVRIAVGAQPNEIRKLVLGQEMVAVAIGVAAGIGSALVITRLFSSLLYEVTPTDAATYGVASLVFWAAALLACYLSTRRAITVNPMTALRKE